MLDSWKKGWRVIVHSVNVLKTYPSFLLPIFVVWGFYVATILYLEYDYQWRLKEFQEQATVAFLFIFSLSFLILMSCTILLEMIKQIEAGEPSIKKAVVQASGKSAFRILPLSIIWAVIWFILTILEALLSKRQDNNNDALTAESAAATVANYREFSFSAASVGALDKGVRMVMFLIVPAIAWDNLSCGDAVKKGLAVLKANLGSYGRGYALTYAAAGIVFLPPGIVFELGRGHDGNPPLFHFPDYVWVGTIIYIGLAWSFLIYLEQMFMAQLYLWHKKWEKEVAEAQKRNEQMPQIQEIDCPELLAKTLGHGRNSRLSSKLSKELS